jgi:hypothetical protein
MVSPKNSVGSVITRAPSRRATSKVPTTSSTQTCSRLGVNGQSGLRSATATVEPPMTSQVGSLATRHSRSQQAVRPAGAFELLDLLAGEAGDVTKPPLPAAWRPAFSLTSQGTANMFVGQAPPTPAQRRGAPRYERSRPGREARWLRQ